MRLLLDTHTAIWWINGHERLSSKARAMLRGDTHDLYISIISVWEIAIKASLGKLPELKGGSKAFLTWLKDIPVNLLPIVPRHVERVEGLPFIHRDLFDRLLIATAQADGMVILTADENIHRYDVPVIW